MVTRLSSRADSFADDFAQLLAMKREVSEEVDLVVEVPVHRAAGDVGFFRDFVQRGAGDAARIKNLFRRVEERGAGFFGVFFGAAGHEKKSIKRLYIQTCMDV